MKKFKKKKNCQKVHDNDRSEKRRQRKNNVIDYQ